MSGMKKSILQTFKAAPTTPPSPTYFKISAPSQCVLAEMLLSYPIRHHATAIVCTIIKTLHLTNDQQSIFGQRNHQRKPKTNWQPPKYLFGKQIQHI